MSDLQKKLLEMLKWFHNFCVEHNLVYYAIGGTLLGAVRHHGYIPWDDDVDLGLPRKDYVRLIEYMKECNSDKFVLECPSSKKDFVYGYCKLYDTTTTLIENTRYKTKRGAYIDIFPIDGIGNNLEESKKNFTAINRKLNFVNTKVCALRKGRAFYKNLAIILSRCVPGNWQKSLQKVEKLCAAHDYDESLYVGNLYGNWHEKEIVKKEWLGNPRLYTFEDMQLYGPQNADAYLTAIYGDYMTLPPIEKQASHHDYILLDLDKSYECSEGNR